MKKLIGILASFILSLPFFVIAQEDSGTYIDNLNVQDSSYMEQDLLAGTETASSGNTTIYIIVAVVVVAIVAFVLLKKKKKK
jgi:LPXTG-motif cell wall-anchored protein